MLTAEAKKAGKASEDTRLKPGKPPSFIGRLACSHQVSGEVRVGNVLNG